MDETARTRSFTSKADARQALSGLQQPPANRFFRGATAKSTDFQTTSLGGSRERLEYFSPANNAGYGKRYVQQINAVGDVLLEYKETLGPEGLIETNWIHGFPEEPGVPDR